jgi:hypothetical protein
MSEVSGYSEGRSIYPVARKRSITKGGRAGTLANPIVCRKTRPAYSSGRRLGVPTRRLGWDRVPVRLRGAGTKLPGGGEGRARNSIDAGGGEGLRERAGCNSKFGDGGVRGAAHRRRLRRGIFSNSNSGGCNSSLEGGEGSAKAMITPRCVPLPQVLNFESRKALTALHLLRR